MKGNADVFRQLTEGDERREDFNHPELPDILKCKVLNGGNLRELQILEKGSMKGTLNLEKGMTKEEMEKAEEELEDEIVQNQKIKTDINYADQIKNEYNTKYKAIELSTGATNRVMATFSKDLLNDLFGFIMDISNFKENDLDTLKQFRKKQRGSDAS